MKLLKYIFCAFVALSLLATPLNSYARKRTAKSNSQVIFTGDLANKVYGYNGKTPLNIYIKDGKIERIEALPNDETPQYLKRATARIFPLYEGKTVSEALKMHVDAVSGATYTSEALIKNIQKGLEQAASDKKNIGKKRH